MLGAIRLPVEWKIIYSSDDWLTDTIHKGTLTSALDRRALVCLTSVSTVIDDYTVVGYQTDTDSGEDSQQYTMKCTLVV
jgi:hypothetical protein